MEGVEQEHHAPHSREDLSRLDAELQHVIEGRACQLQFTSVYTRVYRLVTQHGCGREVYYLCTDTFVRMAKWMGRKRYDLGVRLVASLCMYLEQVWVRRHNYRPLVSTASAIYEWPRLIARRRWRKAIRIVIRLQRIEDWLVAFNQHAFGLGGHSAARVAAHYAAFVAENEL